MAHVYPEEFIRDNVIVAPFSLVVIVTLPTPVAALSSATLHKSFTHICLCHQALQFGRR